VHIHGSVLDILLVKLDLDGKVSFLGCTVVASVGAIPVVYHFDWDVCFVAVGSEHSHIRGLARNRVAVIVFGVQSEVGGLIVKHPVPLA